MIASKQIAFGKAAGAKKPYDAEIEYLESTGTQYINTGIYITPQDIINVDFRYSTTKPPDGLAMQNGVWVSGTGNPHVIFTLQSGRFCGYTDMYSAQYESLARGDTNRHRIKIDLLSGEYIFDGVVKFPAGIKKAASYPFYVYARNSNSGGEAQHFCVEEIYGFSVVRNNGKILDLIPVRKGNVGYMYDRVSGQLFGNAGTGAFVLGPDL